MTVFGLSPIAIGKESGKEETVDRKDRMPDIYISNRGYILQELSAMEAAADPAGGCVEKATPDETAKAAEATPASAKKPAERSEEISSASPDPGRIPQIDPEKTAVWTTADLNIRSGCGTSYPVVTTIPEGTKVTKTGTGDNGKWYYIEYDGEKGFGAGNYFTDKEPRQEYIEETAAEGSDREDFSGEDPADAAESFSEIREQETPYESNDCLGQFEITYYCPCEECNGGWQDGITELGNCGTPYYTIAVDPSVIPLGTTVVINGNEYLAQDTGVYGHHIDMLVGDHQEALDMGVTYGEVYIRE